jgi:hypothetical protein
VAGVPDDRQAGGGQGEWHRPLHRPCRRMRVGDPEPVFAVEERLFHFPSGPIPFDQFRAGGVHAAPWSLPPLRRSRMSSTATSSGALAGSRPHRQAGHDQPDLVSRPARRRENPVRQVMMAAPRQASTGQHPSDRARAGLGEESNHQRLEGREGPDGEAGRERGQHAHEVWGSGILGIGGRPGRGGDRPPNLTGGVPGEQVRPALPPTSPPPGLATSATRPARAWPAPADGMIPAWTARS